MHPRQVAMTMTMAIAMAMARCGAPERTHANETVCCAFPNAIPGSQVNRAVISSCHPTSRAGSDQPAYESHHFSVLVAAATTHRRREPTPHAEAVNNKRSGSKGGTPKSRCERKHT